MHKLVILLVKATDKTAALEKVNSFMEPYGDGDVWDWFAIGGRWSNILAPNREQYDQWAEAFIKERNGNKDYVTVDLIEKHRPDFQAKWEELGFTGLSPYADHYRLPDGGADYDIVPLKDCLPNVKAHYTEQEEVIRENWERLVEERNKRILDGKGTMDGYYAKKYSEAVYGNFSWEFTVYDAENEQPSMPDENEVPEYFAVAVDMHN